MARRMPARSQRPVCSSITAEGTGTPDDPDRIPYAALASESQTAPGARLPASSMRDWCWRPMSFQCNAAAGPRLQTAICVLRLRLDTDGTQTFDAAMHAGPPGVEPGSGRPLSAWQKVKRFFGGDKLDRQRLAALGLGAVASYGFVSNVTYGGGMAVAWIAFVKQRGLSPLMPGQWKAFLAFYAGAGLCFDSLVAQAPVKPVKSIKLSF